MTAIAWITGVLLIIGFGMAGFAKVSGQQMMMDAADHLGVARSQFKLIGAAEIAGAIGVLIGLLSEDLEWLGLLAAAGLVIVGVGAFVFHQRAGDAAKDAAPALVLAIVAVIFLGALAS